MSGSASASVADMALSPSGNTRCMKLMTWVTIGFVRHVMQWYAVPVEFDVTGGDRMCFVGVSARAGRCDDGCASEGVDAEHYRLLTVSRAVVSDSDETGCTCA